jgi:arginase family enzyme
MNTLDAGRDDPKDPILELLPKPPASNARYAIVNYPGEFGHPDSAKIARGADAMATEFGKMLKEVGAPCVTETVDCPKRPGTFKSIGAWFGRRLASLGGSKPKPADALRNFDQVKVGTQRNYDATRAHLLAGEQLLCTAGSHDALGRVLAGKNVFPDFIVLDFDKHPDLQRPGSGDNPGDASAVNEHASWGTAALGEGGPVLEAVCPPNAPARLERRDLFMVGIKHPDPSEAYLSTGIDPVTKERRKRPIPTVTAKELNYCEKSDEVALEQKLREWIDERKARYGVDTVHIGIEDDPDSTRFEDIGPGNTMPTEGGLTSQFKINVLEWLRSQPDVRIVYYGTCELMPEFDQGGKLQRQIKCWAAAALGFADPQYYYKGYGGGTEPDWRAALHTRNRGGLRRHAVPATIGGIAAGILAVAGSQMFQEKKETMHATKPTAGNAEVQRFQKPFTAKQTAEYMKVFYEDSGFRKEIGNLREAVAAGDKNRTEATLANLVNLYKAAKNTAPNTEALTYVEQTISGELILLDLGREAKLYNRFMELKA